MDKDDATICAQRLKKLIAQLGINQQTLSQKCNITKSLVSHYCNGKAPVSADSAKKIALQYGINPLWIMGFDVPEYTDQSDYARMKKLYDNLNNKNRKMILDLMVILGENASVNIELKIINDNKD